MTDQYIPFLYAQYAAARGDNDSLFPDYIQPAKTPTVRPTRRTLNSVATTAVERQMMTAADGAIIPLIYARQRVGAKIAVVTASGTDVYLLAVGALGECDAIESVLFDGEEKPASIVAQYLGTTTQLPDPTLASIITDYNDNWVITHNGQQIGVCYAVLKVKATEFPSQIEMIIRGLKVYDPRTTLTEYSTNPALCLANFINNDIYGQGKTVNWDSVALVADDNDETVGGLKRREINIAIDRLADTSRHVDALRAYAACFVIQDDAVKFVSDRPAAVSRVLTASDVVDGSLTIKKSGTANLPTIIRVVYTDTTAEPWKDAEAVAELPGLTERRESIVPLPGITTYAQARREAIERLNALTLSDLMAEWTSFDESLAEQVGDVIELSHPKGLTAKKLRILDVNQVSAGRYRITAAEYDPAVYSNNIETEPTHPDTTLPSPGAPTAVSNVVVAEELFQQGTGAYAYRLQIGWDAPDYPYVQHYRVVVRVAGKIVFEATTTSTEIATASVLELAQHDVSVTVFSGLAYSPEATDTIIPLGKYWPPGDVPQLNGFEAGGRVYLQWPSAIDIDIWKYEIRYGSVGVAWSDALLIDRTDSLRLLSDEIPAGTWDFLIKALDSVSNYSANATRRTLTVTLDDNAFLADSYEFDSPVLTSMHEYKLARSDVKTHAVSVSGQTWNALFPAAMDTYANALLSYQNDVLSEYLSETWDAGLELSGDWAAEIDYTIISGTVTEQLELSVDNIAWDVHALNIKATARFARIRIKSDTGLFLVNWPIAQVRVNSVPRTENGESTSLSAGAKTVTLANEYSKVQSVSIAPMGTAPRSYAIDNIDLSSVPNTFDVYVFDSAGAQVVNDFLWQFNGV